MQVLADDVFSGVVIVVRLTASAKATAVRRSFMRRRKPDTTVRFRIEGPGSLFAQVPDRKTSHARRAGHAREHR